mmetsp:Transcript_38139/g.99845  ORF Transcript_38139/g.99845 Transcript_38139/m.99845 type:complete len:227 (+) Transcript_38139:3292-3972(+)
MVKEGAELSTRTRVPCLKIRARHGLVVCRVVQLLLGSVCPRAAETARAAVLVVFVRSIPIPVRTRLRTVPDFRHASAVLVGVRVHAAVPIMLYAMWAPERFKLVHKKLVAALGLLVPIKCGRRQLILAVRKRAQAPSPAGVHIRVGGAESLLQHLRVVQNLHPVVRMRARVPIPAASVVQVILHCAWLGRIRTCVDPPAVFGAVKRCAQLTIVNVRECARLCLECH